MKSLEPRQNLLAEIVTREIQFLILATRDRKHFEIWVFKIESLVLNFDWHNWTLGTFSYEYSKRLWFRILTTDVRNWKWIIMSPRGNLTAQATIEAHIVFIRVYSATAISVHDLVGY